MVITPSPTQFATSYSFFTDPTYPDTSLVVVRSAGTNGFRPVNLDCAGELKGWSPIVGTPYEYTRLDLVRRRWEPQGKCNNGRHTMTSDGPFGATVWGWGSLQSGVAEFGKPGFSQAVSYALPVGGFSRALNNVPVK